MNDYQNLDDLAKKLGISKISLYRYIKSGRLKAVKLGKEYKVSEQAAEELVESFKKDQITTQKEKPKEEKPKEEPKKEEKHKHGNKGLKLIQHINSPVIESLMEMMSQNISFDDVQNILSEHAKDCLDLVKKIKSEGVTNVNTAVSLLLVDEAIRNLQTRRLLFKHLINREALILLPLPPHLSDSLLTVASHDLVFTADQVLPPHLKFSPYKNVEMFRTNGLTEAVKNVKAIAIEGYIENNQVYSRSSIVEFINRLADHKLEQIFIHPIPHIPPHSHFIELQLNELNKTIFKI